MAAYSIDLRKRVIRAWDASGDAEAVAATFPHAPTGRCRRARQSRAHKQPEVRPPALLARRMGQIRQTLRLSVRYAEIDNALEASAEKNAALSVKVRGRQTLCGAEPDFSRTQEMK